METLEGWQIIAGLLALGVLVWGVHKFKSRNDRNDSGSTRPRPPGPPGGGGTPPQQMK